MSARANAQARRAAEASGRSQHNETRERIIREARRLFLERGYEGAAMSELAKRAGVTTPAVYWHFASKAELCAEVLDRDYRDFLHELGERTVGATPDERLRAFSATYVELQIRDRDLAFNVGYTQLHDKVSDAAQVEIKSAISALIGALQEILRDGQESGDFTIPDLTLTSRALLSMLEYVYVWFRPDGRLSAQEVGALYADLAANALKRRHA